jgi:hypothetical protein
MIRKNYNIIIRGGRIQTHSSLLVLIILIYSYHINLPLGIVDCARYN